MDGRVTFLHGADLHLGSPLNSSGNVPAELLDKLRDAGYTAFQRMIDAALRHEVDFVVLCGDIYDQTERSARAKGFFIEQTERLNAAAIPVYLIYGNHDPLTKRPAYFKYPRNVHILAADQVEIIEVTGRDDRIIARILGQSYSQPSEKRKMHKAYLPPDHDVPNIGLLHTALNPALNNYVPCSAAELKKISYIDYWALGHVHNRRIINSNYPVIAYPGIPQGRDLGEPGVGGCFLVTAQRKMAAKLAFIPTSPIAWLSCEVPVKDSDSSEDDLVAALTEQGEHVVHKVAANVDPGLKLPPGETIDLEGIMVRWIFTGRGKIHDMIAADSEIGPMLVERMRRESGVNKPFLWTEDVRFETASPLVDPENVIPEDVVINTILQTCQALADDPSMRDEVVKRIGKGWYEQTDGEDIRDKNIPLNNETYNSIIKRALQLAVTRIMEGRAHK